MLVLSGAAGSSQELRNHGKWTDGLHLRDGGVVKCPVKPRHPVLGVELSA